MNDNNLNNVPNNQNNNIKNNKNNTSNKNFTSILIEKSSEKDDNTNIKQTEINSINAAELMFNGSKINKVPIVKSGIERDIEIAKNALKNVQKQRSAELWKQYLIISAAWYLTTG